MKGFLAVAVISLVLAQAPPPRITVQNPKLLYAAAMYKTAVGDTESALRLVQRAEQAQQSSHPARPGALRTLSHRSACFTIL